MENQQAVKTMTGLVRSMVLALVDYPEFARVEVLEAEGRNMIEIRVADLDVGKLIGKQGRTARSMRVIANAAGMKLGTNFGINIIGPDGIRKVQDSPSL